MYVATNCGGTVVVEQKCRGPDSVHGSGLRSVLYGPVTFQKCSSKIQLLYII